MTRTEFFTVRTAHGFVGMSDAFSPLSTDCPYARAYTFTEVVEAFLYAERCGGEVLDRDGHVVPRDDEGAECGGLVSYAEFLRRKGLAN